MDSGLSGSLGVRDTATGQLLERGKKRMEEIALSHPAKYASLSVTGSGEDLRLSVQRMGTQQSPTRAIVCCCFLDPVPWDT